MAEKTIRGSSGVEKRGGYTGGRPAASVRPPMKIPSGAIKPASNSNGSSAKK